ncbi:MAG: hypothetical protein DME18_03155, partial [Verrucomicrobia bacterium]
MKILEVMISSFSRNASVFRLAVFSLSAAFSVVAGQVFHVSPSGNDNNPGTQAQPFREIRKAITAVTPGDTALVAD